MVSIKVTDTNRFEIVDEKGDHAGPPGTFLKLEDAQKSRDRLNAKDKLNAKTGKSEQPVKKFTQSRYELAVFQARDGLNYMGFGHYARVAKKDIITFLAEVQLFVETHDNELN